MPKTIKDIRAEIQKRQQKKQKINYNTDVYPFWKIKEGDVAVVRILPDGNPENEFPLVERLDHYLEIDGQKRRITCPKTPEFGGKKCPICELSAEYYNAKDEKSGKYYYRSSSHLARALVISDPLPPDPETGENYTGKVVTLQLGYNIYNKITADLGNVFEDTDPLPWGIELGFNFNLKKSLNKAGKSEWSATSFFDRRPSPIPDEFLENIELKDLRELLGDPVSYDEANEFLAKHLSSSPDRDDSDSLTNKRASTTSSSGDDTRSKLLNALRGDVEEEQEEDNSDEESVSEPDVGDGESELEKLRRLLKQKGG